MAGLDIAPIVRAQDYTFIKHNEDIKPNVDQNLINIAREEKETRQNEDVVNASQSEWNNEHPDAREKGSNEYYGDGGNERRNPREKKAPVNKVVLKGQSGGFDIKI